TRLNAQKNTIPPFKVMRSNGSFFTSKEIPHNKPVLLIYFAPDCSHCQKLLGEFFKRLKDFHAAEIILVTFKPVGDLVEFDKQYELEKYHNIISGTEGNTFYLRYFYNIATTPFTALYDKKGKLVASYRKETPVDDLAKKVKAMK
ncbi:MAG: TlpA family protein disulfide reductase, partial [Flavisolibacter sp.]